MSPGGESRANPLPRDKPRRATVTSSRWTTDARAHSSRADAPHPLDSRGEPSLSDNLAAAADASEAAAAAARRDADDAAAALLAKVR